MRVSSEWSVPRVVLLLAVTLSATPATVLLASATGQRPEWSVRFELQDPNVSRTEFTGQRLALHVQVSGPPDADHIVAIVEGASSPRMLVPMIPGSTPASLTSTIPLDPYPERFTARPPKALRIEVTLARLDGMKLERFLRRAVYLTFGIPGSSPGSALPKASAEGETRGLETPVEEVPSSSVALSDEEITESDLPAPASHLGFTAYWHQIQRRIHQSWSQRLKQGHQPSRQRSVRVGFQLRPNGEAQLIQIERSSGQQDLDEAGLQAVLNAHPFPPFPLDLPQGQVQVHVDLHTTSR